MDGRTLRVKLACQSLGIIIINPVTDKLYPDEALTKMYNSRLGLYPSVPASGLPGDKVYWDPSEKHVNNLKPLPASEYTNELRIGFVAPGTTHTPLHYRSDGKAWVPQ